MPGPALLASLLLLVVVALPCRAETSAPSIPAPEHRTLEAFGANNPACMEWSDACAICLRNKDGIVGCSLPGIACQAGAIVCKTPTSDAVPY